MCAQKECHSWQLTWLPLPKEQQHLDSKRHLRCITIYDHLLSRCVTPPLYTWTYPCWFSTWLIRIRMFPERGSSSVQWSEFFSTYFITYHIQSQTVKIVILRWRLKTASMWATQESVKHRILRHSVWMPHTWQNIWFWKTSIQRIHVHSMEDKEGWRQNCMKHQSWWVDSRLTPYTIPVYWLCTDIC